MLEIPRFPTNVKVPILVIIIQLMCENDGQPHVVPFGAKRRFAPKLSGEVMKFTRMSYRTVVAGLLLFAVSVSATAFAENEKHPR